MGRANQHTEAAIAVAEWLDDHGEAKRANDVRSVCRSLSTARTTMSQLHGDNMALRRERRMIELGAPSEEVLAVALDLELTGDLKTKFDTAIKERGKSAADLIADILLAVIGDNLFSAVIDE